MSTLQDNSSQPTLKLLLIDSAGDAPSLALVHGGTELSTMLLPGRTASSALVSSVRAMLAEQQWSIRDLDGVGVVAGPGSFTGVRAGLAAAKGLCEAAGLRLAAVSRLAVLMEAADVSNGFAALFAGRGEVYVREQTGPEAFEWLASIEELKQRAAGQPLALAEETLAAQLTELHPVMRPLCALDMLPAVARVLAAGGSDLAAADANYVRSAEQIYGRAGLAPVARRSS